MTDPPLGMCPRAAFINVANECAEVTSAVVKSSSVVSTRRPSKAVLGANAIAWTTMSIGTVTLAKNACDLLGVADVAPLVGDQVRQRRAPAA